MVCRRRGEALLERIGKDERVHSISMHVMSPLAGVLKFLAIIIVAEII